MRRCYALANGVVALVNAEVDDLNTSEGVEEERATEDGLMEVEERDSENLGLEEINGNIEKYQESEVFIRL